MKKRWMALLMAAALTAVQVTPLSTIAADVKMEDVKAVSVIHSVTPKDASVESGGTVEFTVTGENLEDNVGIKVSDLLGEVPVDTKFVENSSEKQIVQIQFPKNNTEWAKTYTVDFYADGDTSGNASATCSVHVGGGEQEAVIYMLNADKTSTDGKQEEKVTFTVYGEGLAEHVAVGVFLDGVKQSMLAVFHEEECSQTKQVFSILFPQNAGEEDKVYEVKTAPKKDSTQWFGEGVNITVKGNQVPPIEEGTSVTAISSTPVGANGLTYRISFQGKNLSENNVVISVTPLDGVIITEKNITKDQGEFLITFPENRTGKDIEYQVMVAPKDGVGDAKSLNFLIKNTEEDDREEIDLKPTAVVIDDTYKVINMAFDCPVFNACESIAQLKEKISLKMGFAERPLSEGDKISFDKNKVVIELEEEYKPLIGGLGIIVGEKALCTTEDKVLKPFTWVIDDTARVTDVVVTPEIMEWEGGEVIARLKGYHLKDARIEGKIIDVRTSRENPEIQVQVEYDENHIPYLKYTAPANESETTQGWLLKLTVNGVPVSEGLDYQDIAKRPLVCVLPKDCAKEEITLGNMTVNSYGANPDPDNLTYTETSTNQESKKIQVHLYGTNLDPKKTKVKIVDEDGVEWPIYNVPQFDSVWYFIMVGNDGTGITGSGNHQILEIICPRNIATDRKYDIYVSVDGEEFVMDQHVTVCVVNRGEQGLAKPEKRTVTVQHVDEQGNTIADADVLTGYSWFFMADMGIAPKEIPGYHVVNAPQFEELIDTLGDADRTEQIVYEKDDAGQEPGEGENPGQGQKPEEDEKPGNPVKNPDGTLSGNGEKDSQNAAKGDDEEMKDADAPKTGDLAEPLGLVLGAMAALGTAAVVVRRRK